MKQKRTQLIPLLLVVVSLGMAEPRGWLGIYNKELDQATEAALGVDHGVLLSEVVENSPASGAGLKVGDVILKVDSQEISSADDISQAIGDRPGKTVHIEYQRLGHNDTVNAKLGTRERQLEFDVSQMPEIQGMGTPPKPMAQMDVQSYMKDINDLKEEIVILRREIERLRKELKKIEK